MEVWKTIEGYHDYMVSDLGRIISLKYKRNRILKGGIDSSGYKIVSLLNEGKQETRTIHQLVAIAFLNHTPNGRNLVINHKNFIKTDNRVENLEIVTMRENSNKKHIKQSSKYVGVCWCNRCKKWNSRIYLNGKRKHLGYFANEIDAHNAYQEKLKTLVIY